MIIREWKINGKVNTSKWINWLNAMKYFYSWVDWSSFRWSSNKQSPKINCWKVKSDSKFHNFFAKENVAWLNQWKVLSRNSKILSLARENVIFLLSLPQSSSKKCIEAEKSWTSSRWKSISQQFLQWTFFSCSFKIIWEEQFCKG